MKRGLLIVVSVAVMLSASLAFGQAGAIMLYADVAYTSCNIIDNVAGNVFVYAVHNFATVGAKSSQWAVTNGGHTMVYITDIINPPNLKFGLNSQQGMAVGYGGCQASPWLIAQIFYSALGNSPACSFIEVVPDPADATGKVTGSSCGDVLTFPGTSRLTLNSDGSCTCGQIQNPVEETSWGQIKALYQ